MKISPLLSSPKGGTRIGFAGTGVVLLVLSVNQLVWNRWVSAAILGSLGLGLVLAGVLASDATLMREAIGSGLRIVLWNVMFVAGVAAVALSVDRAASELAGISMPYILALWLLALGARFASRRLSVIAIAVADSLLLLLQCAIYGIGIVLSPYHFEHRTLYQLLLAAAIGTGVTFVWWFIHAKRSQASERGR